MITKQAAAFLKVVAGVIRQHVDASLKDVQARLESVEQRAAVPGPQGDRGEIGLKGEPGTHGLDGINGKDGQDGRDGLDGAPGERGEKGDPGEPGAAFDLNAFTAALASKAVAEGWLTSSDDTHTQSHVQKTIHYERIDGVMRPVVIHETS